MIPITANVLFLSIAFCQSVTSTRVETLQSNDDKAVSSHQQMNIAFDLPDITATVKTASGDFQLEAYKSIDNDRILNGGSKERTSRLFWVSVGFPNFVKTVGGKSSKNSKLFHFSAKGFRAYIEMMTDSHRLHLAKTATTKYQVNISDAQVVNLILSSFKCSLLLFDETGKKYLLDGKVTDFRHFPLRMDFYAPLKSHERKLFLDFMYESEADLEFDCSMESSGGKLMKTNTLVINADQLQQIGLEEKLFGPSGAKGKDSVYVTRDQMTTLASEMYSTLNIVEDYQMPEIQFSEEFVNGLISQVNE